jgi:hypothetical protein
MEIGEIVTLSGTVYNLGLYLSTKHDIRHDIN